MPADPTLYGLHRAVQIAFGWKACHLHGFTLQGRRCGATWMGELTMTDTAARSRSPIVICEFAGEFSTNTISATYGSTTSASMPGSRATRARSTHPASPARAPGRPRTSMDRSATALSSSGCALAPLTGSCIAGEDEGKDDGFDDDPLGTFNPERFSRQEVNAELKREWSDGNANAG